MLSRLSELLSLSAPGALVFALMAVSFLAGARPKTSALVGPFADAFFAWLGKLPGRAWRRLVAEPCLAFRKAWRNRRSKAAKPAPAATKPAPAGDGGEVM